VNIKELRASTGMTQSEFGKYFNIPMRTIQNWEGGKRNCPKYLVELIEYKLEKEEIRMKRYFITNNAYREIVFAKSNKGFVFDSPDGVFEGVDLYQEPAEVLSQLKKLGIDDSNFDDLCRTFPAQIIEINESFFDSNSVYEF